jgi:hypothetical protein
MRKSYTGDQPSASQVRWSCKWIRVSTAFVGSLNIRQSNIIEASEEQVMTLTGRFNLRKSISGRIVLQVEEEVKTLLSVFARARICKRRWRDATLLDLAAVELRPLIDLRYRPRSSIYLYTKQPCPSDADSSAAIPVPSATRPSKPA